MFTEEIVLGEGEAHGSLKKRLRFGFGENKFENDLSSATDLELASSRGRSKLHATLGINVVDIPRQITRVGLSF